MRTFHGPLTLSSLGRDRCGSVSGRPHGLVESPAEHFQLMRDRCDVRRVRDRADIEPFVKLPLTSKDVQAVARLTKLSRVRQRAREREPRGHEGRAVLTTAAATSGGGDARSAKRRASWRFCS